MKYVYASATVVGASFAGVFLLGTNPKQAMILAMLQLVAILLVLCFEKVLEVKI